MARGRGEPRRGFGAVADDAGRRVFSASVVAHVGGAVVACAGTKEDGSFVVVVPGDLRETIAVAVLARRGRQLLTGGAGAVAPADGVAIVVRPR